MKLSSAQIVALATILTTKVAANAASAPEPEPGLTLLDPHLGEPPPSEACQGQPVLAGMSRDPTPPFSGLTAPPPLSLCLTSCWYHKVMFYERVIICVITVITLSSFTGKVPCVTQLPPTLASNNHTVIICV